MKNETIDVVTPSWYKLDNTARIYPAIRNKKWSSNFRMSVVMKQPVQPELLQQAMEITLKRIPSFSVNMKAGLFWYFFEHDPAKPKIQKDVSDPCTRMFGGANGNFLFRVRWHTNIIALEVFHSITDGNGAITFLKTMTAEYLKLLGHPIPPRTWCIRL